MPVSERANILFILSVCRVGDQANSVGLAGTIAVAMKTAEMARAKAAAKRRLPVSEFVNITWNLFHLVSGEPFPLDANYSAWGVPKTKNG